MEIAGGVFKWTEQQFWNTSLQYFLAAIDGWVECNGGKRTSHTGWSTYSEDVSEYAADLALSDADLARIRERRQET